MKNRLTEMFGIEFPIFAFSHCRDVVAAVTNAGGMGVLGALAFTNEQLELELNWIDEHVGGKPYGVDVVMPVKTLDRDAGIADTADMGAMAHHGCGSTTTRRGRAVVDVEVMPEWSRPGRTEGTLDNRHYHGYWAPNRLLPLSNTPYVST